MVIVNSSTIHLSEYMQGQNDNAKHILPEDVVDAEIPF